jgi:curved DNA-binding protein CbpA
MHLERTFYDVLGLSPKANLDEIKDKYRELARRYHPDLSQDKTLFLRIFKQINQAYRTLSDPERRAAYDEELSARPDVEKMVRDADMALMVGDATKARTLAKAAITENPDHARAYSVLGDALVQLSLADEATEAYKHSLALAPSAMVQARLIRLQTSGRIRPTAPASR